MADGSEAVDRRTEFARSWDALVDEVRRLGPDLEDFLRPPGIGRLVEAAAAGPVVVVNVSTWRCDALIVRRDGIEPVPLRRLTAADVAARTGAQVALTAEVQDLAAQLVQESAGASTPAAVGRRQLTAQRLFDARDRLEANLDGLLRWLWDVVAAPVLAALAVPAGTWPRVWWCLTGRLAFLPLHAAGHHDSAGDTVLDRVVSSYTPTLEALLEARRPVDRTARPRMLLVSVVDSPSAGPLDVEERERRTVRSVFAGWLTELSGPAATRDAVLAALAGHGWLHFTGHAGQRLDDPSQGGLLLTDGLLTVEEIAAGHHAGEFAFLAACETATGGWDLADEVITLAAALHYTGFRHVIGTLWPVSDRTVVEVAEAVYADLFRGGALTADTAAYACMRLSAISATIAGPA